MGKSKKGKTLQDYHSEKADRYVKELRQNATKAELHFKQMLIDCGIEFVFQRAVKAPGLFCIIDFYTPNPSTCVEIDGGYHRELEQQGKDARRDAYMRKKGCRTIRLTNEQVLAMTSADLLLKGWFIPTRKPGMKTIKRQKHSDRDTPTIGNYLRQAKKEGKLFSGKKPKFEKKYPKKASVLRPVESKEAQEQRKLDEMAKLLADKLRRT